MTRLAIIAAVVLATLAGGSVGALALADSSSHGELPAGARIAGVDVGGLTPAAALRRADERVAARITRPVRIQIANRAYTLTAKQAGVRVDLRSVVDDAYAAGRKGSFLHRGWRKITGDKISYDRQVPVTLNHAAVVAFVRRIEREQATNAVGASLKMTLTSVTVTAAKPGRRLAARDALVARLTRRLTTQTDARVLRAKTVPIDAKLTAAKVFDATPMALTVSREQKRVRLFKRGKLVKIYIVAVGSPVYPTPTGRFAVQSMQRNPSWNVPQSAWAGSLAGKTIPGGAPGNPLVARWIGFAGSVGFHGTAEAGSLGSAASHGCVRMDPKDVIDLFSRVTVGTPVLVA